MAGRRMLGRLVAWSATVALLVTTCGDADNGETATTSTTIAAPDLGLGRPVAVTNADGVFQIGADGTVTPLHDGTVAGLTHEEFPLVSIQYHSEASPGPLDNGYLFDEFLDLVRAHKATKTSATEKSGV